MNEGVPQREHSLREVLNGLRYMVRTGIAVAFHAQRLAAVHIFTSRGSAGLR